MSTYLPRRVTLALVLAAVAASALTAAVSAGAQARPARSAKAVVITLKNYMFNPSKVTIAPGTTVTWRWEDKKVFHNVTPVQKKGSLMFPASKDQDKGTYSYRFTKKGDYYYQCTFHEATMQAEIIVK